MAQYGISEAQFRAFLKRKRSSYLGRNYRDLQLAIDHALKSDSALATMHQLSKWCDEIADRFAYESSIEVVENQAGEWMRESRAIVRVIQYGE